MLDYKKILVQLASSVKDVVTKLQTEDMAVEVPAPAETSTATKTDTKAYTKGNNTVTGGAGVGATNVTITPSEVPEETSAPIETSDVEGKEDSLKTLAELIPVDVDGYFCINISVVDGKLVCGSINANTYKELDLAKQEKQELETKLSSKIKELEIKLADQKKNFEIKLAEIGKESGKNNVIQAPIDEINETEFKLSKRESFKKYILNK